MIAGATPGEGLEVVCARSSRTTVRVYDGEIEALTVAESAGIGVRVVTEGRQGFASAASLDADLVEEVVREARDNARYAEPDQWVALAEPDGADPVPQDLWRSELAETSVDAKIELAMELERTIRGADPRIKGVRTVAYGDSSSTSVLVSTSGMRAGAAGTTTSLSGSALAADGERTQIGGGSSVGRAPSEVSVAEAAEDAVLRATRLIGAKKPASATVTMVLEPRLAATIFGMVGGMLCGDRVLKGRTPFADRVGQMIADPRITLVDDPTNPDSFGADTFDGEGLACRANALIADGELQGFLHNTYTGARSGRASTASAVRGYGSTPGVGPQALAITPGPGDLDEIIARVDNGLLVQSMTGLHSGVNPVSGDFSVGVDGVMIRNGELAEPIREATVASAIQRLLTDIAAVGADVDHLPSGTSAVTIAIDGIALSGS